IKMILYTSYVCFHCADFIRDTLPILKEKYIDAGKLLIVFRTFALDSEDFKAAKIAQCYIEGKYCNASSCPVVGCCDNRNYLRMMNILFNSSLSSGATKTLNIINNIAHVNFMNYDEIDNCMKDKNLELKVLTTKLMAIKSLKMQGTPYMIIDGKHYQGIKNLEFFEKLFDEKIENK
ncbi:MAG: DsbA family protein, partial [Anaplasmataceae bacterium]|nr:DsbA family protein [Anaplasmataceae bacterium]